MNEIVLNGDVKTILQLLSSSGFEAFIVGGCVRDILLNTEPKDYDITTNANTREIKDVFRDYHVIETGIKHGTVTVMINHVGYEITTYRIDSDYPDHRHPSKVTFTGKLEYDLARRDFTINAMAYSEKTGIIDLYEGINDLKNGIIRCVGDPAKRFEEDALRILRCLRFASRLNFEIDSVTRKALFEKKDLLNFISCERILSEFNEIICTRQADRYLDEYRDVITVFLPEIKVMFDFDQNNRHHCYDLWQHTLHVIKNVSPSLDLRWAALFHDLGKYYTVTKGEDGQSHFYNHPRVSAEMAAVILERLRMDKKTASIINDLIFYHDYHIETRRSMKKVLQKIGFEEMEKLIELKKADNLAQDARYYRGDDYFHNLITQMNDIKTKNDAINVSDLTVNGSDLMELGLRNREIGNMLNRLLEEVMADRLSNEKEQLLNYVKRNSQ